MKRKLLFLAILCVSGAHLLRAQVSSIVIEQKDGDESIFALSSLDKLTYTNSNEDLNVDKTSGDQLSFSLADIKKIYFTDAVTGLETLSTSAGSLELYPTIVDQSFKVNFEGETAELLVFDASGVEVLRSTINSTNTTVYVSSLERGMYLVKINGETSKFVKQ
jgi:hypothetical protein